MNSRQKEILQSQLKSEEEVVSELRHVYMRARRDVSERIKGLEARTDVENLQSIVYQKQYQEALKKQLDSILDIMNANQFETISDYLGKCYEDGFLGTMYDLHGQGIPLIMPINQRQMVEAIQIDSKISEGLYKRLGVDTNDLKDSIRQYVSRGIASSQSWADVARSINYRMNIGMNRSVRIARTEGHRVASKSTLDAQRAAKEKGADVVKQWDATLDKRTRPHHARLDGQLREIDDPFEVDGHKAMYPGGFGIASEDINCRCAILQRARWALDEDELTTLKERAEYFGLDKTEDFEEFKKKYLEISENDAQESGNRDIINVEYVESTYGHTHADAVKQQLENADSDVREVWNRYSGDFRTDDPAYSGQQAYYSPSSDSVRLNINYASSGSSYQTPYQVLHHEYGHMTDYLAARQYGHSRYTAFTEVFAGLDEDGKPIFNSEYGSRGLLGETARTELKNLLSQIKKTNGVRRKAEAAQILIDEITSNYSLLARSDVSDMLEGAGIGVAYPLGVGHGTSYWKDRDNGKEIFAEMLSAEAASPESLACIQQYFPETYKVFRTILGVIK